MVWIARIVDAFTDPGMGRLSDMTRWRSGRRRPYFLIGALPFGLFFALMWLSVPFESEFGEIRLLLMDIRLREPRDDLHLRPLSRAATGDGDGLRRANLPEYVSARWLR